MINVLKIFTIGMGNTNNMSKTRQNKYYMVTLIFLHFYTKVVLSSSYIYLHVEHDEIKEKKKIWKLFRGGVVCVTQFYYFYCRLSQKRLI